MMLRITIALFGHPNYLDFLGYLRKTQEKGQGGVNSYDSFEQKFGGKCLNCLKIWTFGRQSK